MRATIETALRHLGKEFLGQRQGFTIAQILRPQQQPGQPRFDRMGSIQEAACWTLHSAFWLSMTTFHTRVATSTRLKQRGFRVAIADRGPTGEAAAFIHMAKRSVIRRSKREALVVAQLRRARR